MCSPKHYVKLLMKKLLSIFKIFHRINTLGKTGSIYVVWKVLVKSMYFIQIRSLVERQTAYCFRLILKNKPMSNLDNPELRLTGCQHWVEKLLCTLVRTVEELDVQVQVSFNYLPTNDHEKGKRRLRSSQALMQFRFSKVWNLPNA